MADPYIPADFPHMVLNSHDLPPPDYEMWRSRKIPNGTAIDFMISDIRKVALDAPDGKLNTLIFNSHGSPGVIHIGRGITEFDLHLFQPLVDDKKPFAAQIWIVACRVGGEADNVSGGPSGDSFCRLLAQTTLSEVTAGVRNQPSSGPVSFPPGCIDAWVGEVFTYYPNGLRVQRQ